METQSLREFIFNPKPQPVINIIIILFNLPVFQSELLPFHQSRTAQKVAPIRIPLRTLISVQFFDSLFLLQGIVVPLKRFLFFSSSSHIRQFAHKGNHLPLSLSLPFEKHFTPLCSQHEHVTTSKLITATTITNKKKLSSQQEHFACHAFCALGASSSSSPGVRQRRALAPFNPVVENGNQKSHCVIETILKTVFLKMG